MMVLAWEKKHGKMKKNDLLAHVKKHRIFFILNKLNFSYFITFFYNEIRNDNIYL